MGKHRWKGELATPIRPKVIRPGGLRVTKKTAQVANEEMEDLYRRAIEEEYLVKLELLMDHYGITDKTDFLVSRSRSQLSCVFQDSRLRRPDQTAMI
jgi:hypothetical protein